MAALIPFRALRPTPAAAPRVGAVPYDVVSAAEARHLAAGNPLSFLHVSRAEIDLPPETNPYDAAVYERAAANFNHLRSAAPLVLDDEPGLYVYRLRMGGHVQTGVAGCYSLDEYDSGVIRKHERTRSDKEDDRTRHMLALRAQTGPVFLTYRDSPTIDAPVEEATAAEPVFDFTADDGVRHTVWRVAPRHRDALVAAFHTVPAMYIADGHHRAASAARARRQIAASQGPGEWDTFVAVAFPHDQMQVLAYNRVINDLAGAAPEALLQKLAERVRVTDGPAVPARRGDVALFLNGRWRTLSLKEPAIDSPVARLDVSRLQDQVLAPLFGIGDVRSDKRIDFVGGARGTAELERLVTSGEAAAAFSMYPVSVEDLMAISDAGEIMPPKSTWFEPKLRDGLLSQLI